jgi:hypothetical protein
MLSFWKHQRADIVLWVKFIYRSKFQTLIEYLHTFAWSTRCYHLQLIKKNLVNIPLEFWTNNESYHLLTVFIFLVSTLGQHFKRLLISNLILICRKCHHLACLCLNIWHLCTRIHIREGKSFLLFFYYPTLPTLAMELCLPIWFHFIKKSSHCDC